MIRGGKKRFFPGSRCFLGEMKAKEFSNEPCFVRDFLAEKQRWAVELAHPRFAGRKILVAEEKLAFDYYVAEMGQVPAIPGMLDVRDDGGCGRALFSTEVIPEGTEVFAEEPFMIVRNQGDCFLSRWNLYFHTLHFQGEQAVVLRLFLELSDGGVVNEYWEDAEQMLRGVLEQNGMKVPPVMPREMHGEVRKIATVLAKWQTNGFAFRCFDGAEEASTAEQGQKGQSALYHYCSKMLHSCEPNCVRKVDEESGVLRVRTCRDIGKNERLTIDYVEGQLDGLSVEERRKVLLKRGFVCQCSRCAREAGA